MSSQKPSKPKSPSPSSKSTTSGSKKAHIFVVDPALSDTLPILVWNGNSLELMKRVFRF
jgi:hypothetical protein